MNKPMSFVTRVVPGNMKIRLAYLVLLLAGAAVIYGCAKVKVRKVPTPTQYIRWTDAQQRKADNMEGIRFYLPRPFLSVFESFPIRTDIYLANGVVSPTGDYVIVSKVTSESGLARHIANPEQTPTIPKNLILDTSTTVKPHAGGLAALAKLAGPKGLGDVARMVSTIKDLQGQPVPTGVEGAQKPPPTQPAAPPPSAPQPTTGRGERIAKNDNGAFAYQPLRGNFDIVYLPDFEEQYVISETAGLGNAMFEVNLGQGWSLQGFNSLTDNSELNRRIFHLIDTAMHLAKSAASAAMGLPPLPEMPPPAADIGVIRPHAKGEEFDGGLPGTPVSLKIVLVHYAAKGLYPVIKPRELQERLVTRDETFGILDLFKVLPKVRWSSDLDPTAITRSQQAIDNQTGSFTVPRYPYQYISFNTFRYMAIEVVRPTDKTTSPFQHLYDKTGTQGPGGQARTGEIVDILRRLFPATTETVSTGKPPDGTDPATKFQQDNEADRRETIDAYLASFGLRSMEDQWQIEKDHTGAIKKVTLVAEAKPDTTVTNTAFPDAQAHLNEMLQPIEFVLNETAPSIASKAETFGRADESGRRNLLNAEIARFALELTNAALEIKEHPATNAVTEVTLTVSRKTDANASALTDAKAHLDRELSPIVFTLEEEQ